MESSTLPLPADVRWRRVIVVVAFLGLLYAFRHLAPVFICFIVLERSLGWLATQIDARTPLHRKGAIVSVLGLLGLAAAGIAFLAIRQSLSVITDLRDNGREYLRELAEHPSVDRLREMSGLQGEELTTAVKEHVGTALSYATHTASLVLFLLVGFVLAIVYLFERDEMDAFVGGIGPRSVGGTLIRWFGYVGDSIAVTVRMQVVVAVVNAVVTLPVLILLGLPHVPLLFLLILVSGLLPVVGNLISGAVLCYVAFTAKGVWAVGVFLGVTFVLGKVESYYLSPRLAQEHVKLPSIVLLISLVLFEQAFGFVGLFLSFPALFVASKIAAEWRQEQEELRAGRPAPPGGGEGEAEPAGA